MVCDGIAELNPEDRTFKGAGTRANTATFVPTGRDPATISGPACDHCNVMAPNNNGTDTWAG